MAATNLVTKLEAIGDAIRSKTGDTELLTLDEMPSAIKGIEAGSGGTVTDFTPPVIIGNCSHMFRSPAWQWYLDDYIDKLETEDMTDTSYMFYGCESLTEIPFDLNFATGTDVDVQCMFEDCTYLVSIGSINNLTPENMSNMFNSCYYLRELPTFVNLDMSTINEGSKKLNTMFNYCLSLRSIPEDFLVQLYSGATSYSYYLYYRGFSNCYVLDELRNIPVQRANSITTNMFSYTFDDCYRLKDVIFETSSSGTAYEASWGNQTIDLSNYVGYVESDYYTNRITNYNSGITADKQVTDASSYAALADDPDWWTTDIAYSRYNHDSAVNTLNSLPDTSAAGVTNTIKFKSGSGSATTAGSVDSVSEEIIASVAERGWTVSFV